MEQEKIQENNTLFKWPARKAMLEITAKQHLFVIYHFILEAENIICPFV